MRRNFMIALALVAVALTSSAAGQQPGSAEKAAAAKTWTVPHTPDGQPDLQGMWVTFDSTPFEKPWPKTAAKKEPKVIDGKVVPESGNEHAAGGSGTLTGIPDRPALVPKRPSMVVDPPDGHVPLTPWGEYQRDYALVHQEDSWEYSTPYERCVGRGVPGGMFQSGYNNAYQILQTPGQVVLLMEMIHEARIIPIDGRPHLPALLKQWNGDPRGHWDGNTLVVESTNFNGRGMIMNSAVQGPARGVPETVDARIVERFTRVDDKTINYEVTINDPKAARAPWTLAMPMTRDDSYRMYEYSCHEGNRNFMEIALGGGRVKDKAAGKK
jgi:hypothetical protein